MKKTKSISRKKPPIEAKTQAPAEDPPAEDPPESRNIMPPPESSTTPNDVILRFINDLLQARVTSSSIIDDVVTKSDGSTQSAVSPPPHYHHRPPRRRHLHSSGCGIWNESHALYPVLFPPEKSASPKTTHRKTRKNTTGEGGVRVERDEDVPMVDVPSLTEGRLHPTNDTQASRTAPNTAKRQKSVSRRMTSLHHDHHVGDDEENQGDVYWLYFSIHCLHTLIGQLEQQPSPKVDTSPKKPPLKRPTVSVPTPRDHPLLSTISSTNTTTAMILIWCSYAVTTQLLSQYWYDDDHDDDDDGDGGDQNRHRSDDTVDDHVAVPTAFSTTVDATDTKTTRVTSPVNTSITGTTTGGSTVTPRNPKLSHLGKHLIGQLLVLMSQATTTALTILSTHEHDASIHDDPDGKNHPSRPLLFFRYTIFAAIYVLDYVTNDYNGHAIATTAKSSSPLSSSPLKKESNAMLQYTYWKQQSLLASFSITTCVWQNTIRPLLSYHCQRVTTPHCQRDGDGETANWTLIEECHNELLRYRTSAINQRLDVSSQECSTIAAMSGSSSSVTTAATLESLHKCFARLIQQTRQVLRSSTRSVLFNVRLDSRISVKRWSSIALVWYRPGQEQLLRCAYSLLLKSDNLTEVTKDNHHGQNSDDTNGISNVLWVSMISRLCDIVHDVGQTAGKNSPVTSMNSTTHNDNHPTGADTGIPSAITPSISVYIGNGTTGYDVYVQNLVNTLCAASPKVTATTARTEGLDTNNSNPSSSVSAAEMTTKGKKSKKKLKSDVATSNTLVLLTSESVPTTTVHQNNAAPKLQRTDICDLVMVVSYHLLQLHYQSISMIQFSSVNGIVINSDDDDKFIERQSTRTGIRSNSTFNPYLTVSLGNLATAAAMNSVSGNTNQATQQRIYCERIEYMIAAWAFMIQESYKCVIDARLSLYSISKLLLCWNMKSFKSQTSINSSSDLNYNIPLPIPSVQSQLHSVEEAMVSPTARKRKKNPTAVAVESSISCAVNSTNPALQHPLKMFAGMYDVVPSIKPSSKKTISSMFKAKGSSTDTVHPNLNDLTSEEKLVLFLRAMNGQAEKLLIHVIWIAASCLHEPRIDFDPDVVSDSTSMEIFSINSAIDLQNKKRKTADGSKKNNFKKQKHNVQDICKNVSESSHAPVCLDSVRVKMLTAAFSVCRSILRDDPTTLSPVQTTLRRSVSTNHIFRLLDLGRMVEDQLLFVWNSSQVCGSSLSSSLDKDNAELWSAVMNFFVIVGKTTHNVVPSNTANDRRLDLYKKVAHLSKVQSSTNTAWPLWLRPSCRLLVTTSLVSSSTTVTTTNSADLFIVKGIITELQHVATNGKAGFAQAFSVERKIAPEIPLSLYDARIFLVAFSRLSKDEQTSYFVSLLATIEMLMQFSSVDVTSQNKPTLSLVGHLVTLSSNTYCMMKLGASMGDKLLNVVENSVTILSWPPDRSTNSDIDPSINCYMGVFDDWENSDLPLLTVPTIWSESVEDCARVEQILNKALKLGFSSAPIDSCHILFAAWNELGKSDLWGPKTTLICPFTSLTGELTTILIRLREEMCHVHTTLRNYHSESIPDSTLKRVLEKRHGGVRENDTGVYLKGLLGSMIDKATKLMDALRESLQLDETTKSDFGDPVKFCLLEACTVYTAFAISSLTRPHTDFFTATRLNLQTRNLGRARGYSTDSDALQHSDAGSDDSHDLLFTAMGRMRDVCDRIGAVPAHPDWLDDDCHLLESVSTSEAAELAMKALKCLTAVLTSGLTKSQNGMLCTLRKLQNENGKISDDTVSLAGTLCLLKYFSENHFPHEMDSQFGSLLGTISDVDSSCLRSIISLRSRECRVAAPSGTKWCPHSSHRIQGKLQAGFRSEVIRELHCEELKSCGEWEMLLASRLSSASIESEVRVKNDDCDPSASEYLSASEHWLVVCESVLVSLVPVAALLRFCVHASGRYPHPLSFIDSATEDFVLEKCGALSLDDNMLGIAQSRSYHETIVSTLVALSYVSSHRTSATIASQLIVEPTGFCTLQGLARYVHALQAINGLQGIRSLSIKGELSIVPILVDQATSVLKQWGIDSQIENDDTLSKTSSCLTSCLLGQGSNNDLRFKTIILEDVDPINALSGNSLQPCLKWDWLDLHLPTMRSLVMFIFDDTLDLRVETRGTLAFVMARVLSTCFGKGALPTKFIEVQNVFVATLNNIPANVLEKVVRDHVCRSSSAVDEFVESEQFDDSTIRESLCTLLAFALHSTATTNTFLRTRQVFEILLKNLQENETFYDCVLDLTFLYATYFMKLETVASVLFQDRCFTQNDDKLNVMKLKVMHKFAGFVDSFSAYSQDQAPSNLDTLVPKQESSSILNNLPICCSYVRDKDFHGQHWYNCHTCGLVNDKGCCTLCAIICHQGHDIVYSRFSSFFCDCGGGEINGIVRCKCLSPQARDSYLTKSSRRIQRQEKKMYQLLSTSTCKNIIYNSFPSNGVAAVQKLSMNDVRTWLRLLFGQARAHFWSWKAQDDEAYRLLQDKCRMKVNHVISTVDSPCQEYYVRPKMSPFYEDFSLVGKSQTIDLKSTTTSWDRLYLDGKTMTANVMDADSRGRVAVVDSSQVMFVSALSMLNSMCVHTTANNRSVKPSLVSTVSIGFIAKGLRFIPDFENSIYVWSGVKAKVIQMTNNFSKIATEKELAIIDTLDRGNNEIVSCRWIVGSGTYIAVGCTYRVFVFDVATEGNSIEPVLTISSLVEDSSLLDFDVVRVSATRRERRWKLFANLENGKIRATTILQNGSGLISEAEATGPIDDLILEECSNRFAVSRSLYYLEKSRVLIYETNLPDIVALFLTEEGTVNKIARLPFSLPLTTSNASDQATVRGPFTFWKEIETRRRGNEDFFRAVCMGYLEKSNAAILISFEFNNGGVCAQDLELKPSTRHEFSPSCIGLAILTAPILATESDSPIHHEKQFKERTVVCGFTVAGSFKFFVEKSGSLTVPILTPSCYSGIDDGQYYTEIETDSMKDIGHSMNIVAIEDFSNVTDSDEVIIGCNELGTATNIKQILHSESDGFLRSPRTAGFMITISVVSTHQKLDSLKEMRDQSHYNDPADSVVTAVRIRLGCKQKTIPRSVKVVGKAYKIVQGVRRWYNFYLSAQDIAYSLRTGFVSIEIDQCHDSTSHPTVDAIEVYALKRRQIQNWLPIAIQSPYADTPCVQGSLYGSSHDSLCLCIESWANIYRIAGKSGSTAEYELIQQLLAQTALVSDKRIFESVSFLLSFFEADEEVRQRSIDNGVLSGCSSFLLKIQTLIKQTTNADPSKRTYWLYPSLIPAVRSCLRTAAKVALHRPFNYPQGVEGSIATNAINIVSACLNCSVSDEVVEDYVELSLMESAIVNGSFDGIRRLLLNKRIASKIYETILRFCKFGDIFAAQTLAVKYVCDNCLLFINDIRYTLVEKDHGLDLCPKCFGIATAYTENRNKNETVKINGKNAGELRCEEVSAMEAVPIQKHTAASSDNAPYPNHDVIFEANGAHQNQLFNDFMDGLSMGISGYLVDEFKSTCDIPTALVELAVYLIRHSINCGRKVDRGKELLFSMVEGMYLRLHDDSDCHKIEDCANLLEGLINTFVPDKCVRTYFLSTENFATICPTIDDGIKSKHVCNMHKLPLSRYKISSGPEKDRIFMACSKEPQHRCNFFVWADKNGGSQMVEKTGLFDEEMGELVWQCLTAVSSDQRVPARLRLSSFIEKLTSSSVDQSLTRNEKNFHVNFSAIQQSFDDGVFCSHGTLKCDYFLKDQVELYQGSKVCKPDIDVNEANSAFVKKALELMSLIAPAGGQSGSQWFPILCRLSSSEKGHNLESQRIRTLARRAILKLCGNDTTISLAIQDQYGFAFLFEKMWKASKELLDACLMLNDKADVCLPHQKRDGQRTFKEVKVRHIIGIDALVSEDASTLERNRSIRGVLREILSMAEKRGNSWRYFCCLQELPSTASSRDQLHDGPPMYLLFALICSVSIENQYLLLRMLKLALSRSSDRKCVPLQAKVPLYSNSAAEESAMINLQICKSPETILNLTTDDLYAFVISFLYRGFNYNIQKESLNIAKKLWSGIDESSQATLLHLLLLGPLYSIGSMGKRSTCFLTFLQSAINSVAKGDFDVCRAISNVQSCLQVQRLASFHDQANGAFFHVDIKSGSAAKVKRYDLGVCSHCHTCFGRVKGQKVGKSTLTSGFSLSATSAPPIDMTWLPGQLSSFSRSKLDMGNERTTTSEFSSFVALKYRSFISTIHIEIESPRRFVKTIKFYFSPRPIDQISVLKSEQYARFWQQCGVVSLSRDSTQKSFTLPTPVVAANLKIEYAEFHDRAVSNKASDGSVIVHCPRCRRAVSNAHGVCGSCGEVAFQCRKCRHINYERLDAFLCVECGYCASASFRYELTAAVATSAVAITNDKDYKVAVNRVRVASQLRDELQSTLKKKLHVITADGLKTRDKYVAVDSRAEGLLPLQKTFAHVLPSSDNDEKSMASKSILCKLGSSGTMVKMIANAVNYENVSSSVPTISLFQSPENRLENASSTGMASSGSLLRDLARDGLTISGEASHDDASATAIASELFSGLFDATGGDSARHTYRLDVNDQLRRLLVSVQSRRREVVDESSRTRSDSAATTSTAGDELPETKPNTSQRTRTATLSTTTTKSTITKEDIELCDKLYHRMCEVECELYELNRRCEAWRRLNNGRLYPAISDSELTIGAWTFEPSHCSACGPVILVHLLLLWLSLFRRDPSSVVVTTDMIVYLFDNDPSSMAQHQQHRNGTNTHQELLETKHLILREIALRSEQGSKLVLEALRLRLVSLMQDQNAVEILGAILEAFASDDLVAVNSEQAYIELAHETLQGNVSQL